MNVRLPVPMSWSVWAKAAKCTVLQMTATRTANCGMAGGSCWQNPSMQCLMWRVYFVCALYMGLFSPVNLMVLEMIARASAMDRTLT
eukprot:4421948-Ditylum_brightwellii.AAC.1